MSRADGVLFPHLSFGDLIFASVLNLIELTFFNGMVCCFLLPLFAFFEASWLFEWSPLETCPRVQRTMRCIRAYIALSGKRGYFCLSRVVRRYWGVFQFHQPVFHTLTDILLEKRCKPRCYTTALTYVEIHPLSFSNFFSGTGKLLGTGVAVTALALFQSYKLARRYVSRVHYLGTLVISHLVSDPLEITDDPWGDGYLLISLLTFYSYFGRCGVATT